MFVQATLWAFAVPMAYAVAWIVRRAALAKTSVQNAATTFLFIMMASMLSGALIYVLNQTITGLIEAVVINMGVMTVGILIVLKYWIEGNVEKITGRESEELASRELERSVIVTRGYVVYFVVVLASMVSFAILYIINHTVIGTEVALGSSMGLTTAGVLLILRYSMKHEFQGLQSGVTSGLSKSTPFRAATVVLVLSNEFLMGWIFALISGINGTSIYTAIIVLFGNVVSSYWFIFIMVIEMAITIGMFRKEIPQKFATILALQAAVMLFSPPAIENQTWTTASLYVTSALMIVLFIYLYQLIYKSKSVQRPTSNYIIRLVAIYAFMLIGLFIWISNHSPLLFSASIVAQMMLYFNAVLNPAIFRIPVEKSYYGRSPLH